MTDSSHYPGSELELFKKAHRWKEYLRRQLSPHIGGHVLEVGAGLGATTLVLHRGDCSSWTCLEPDLNMANSLVKTTEDLLDRSGRAPHIEAKTIAVLEGAMPFDTILYIDVLEHIEDDTEEMRLAAGRLAVHGKLIVLSPAMPSLYSPFDKSIGHFRRYTKESLRETAPPDLSVLSSRYLDSLGILASLANRLLMRSPMPTESQIALWDQRLVPLSQLVDPLLRYRMGKSILTVFVKNAR